MTSSMPEPKYVGKVRATYQLDDDHLLMIASDRISVYDVVLADEIPGKGVVLTHMTKHWLNHTPLKDVAPSHFVSAEPADMPTWAQPFITRSMVVREAKMLPVECIVRGYITGSAWESYKRDGTVNGVKMPDGMQEMDEFPEPMFTPSTKATVGHDENITIAQMGDLLGDPLFADEVIQKCLEGYRVGAEYAHDKGIILVDTKFELGLIDGKLCFCDEVLTPDSSRYVAIEHYEPGKPPSSMDKEYVRSWAREIGWNKQPPAPKMPEEIIFKTKLLYAAIATRLTGTDPLFG